MMLAAFAMAASFLTLSMTATTARPPNSTVEKGVIFADGSEPMPACRKNVCPPVAND
jgi:hypothetical protein